MNPRALEHLLPADIADAVRSRDASAFHLLYGDTLLLLVRLVGDVPELVDGLESTAVRGRAAAPLKPATDSMAFHTVIELPGRGHPGAAPGAAHHETEPSTIAKRLTDGQHFAVPLRKRKDAEALYMDRISVGRARNKDLVLRHSSVSKSHAWFETDDAGAFYVTDAGSKNTTRLNGETLLPRVRTPVRPGDALRFGSIDCAVCSPGALWTAIRDS